MNTKFYHCENVIKLSIKNKIIYFSLYFLKFLIIQNQLLIAEKNTVLFPMAQNYSRYESGDIRVNRTRNISTHNAHKFVDIHCFE